MLGPKLRLKVIRNRVESKGFHCGTELALIQFYQVIQSSELRVDGNGSFLPSQNKIPTTLSV